MIKLIQSKITTEDYYNLEGYAHYSLIKKVAELANRAFNQPKDTPLAKQKVFDLGHILEEAVLGNLEITSIKVDHTPELTGHSKALFDVLLNVCKDRGIKHSSEFSDDEILDIIQSNALWSGTKKRELLLNNAERAFDKLNFYLSLKEGDLIANETVYDTVEKVKLAVKENDAVYNALLAPDADEHLVQYPIVDETNFSIPVKALLDVVNIYHDRKHIEIIDFKSTAESVDRFLSPFYAYKYYYQLPFYTRLFKVNHPQFKDYTFGMSFVVVSNTNPEVTARYILPAEWEDKSWKGFEDSYGRTIRGIQDILDEIEWYLGIGGTTVPKILTDNNYTITIEPTWHVE